MPLNSKYFLTFNLVCLVGFKLSAVKAEAGSGAGRGFGNGINWMSLESGLAMSASTKKPVMVIIHKTWCGACKALKPQFAASKEIKDLSKYFVMVNLEDDEEPRDKQYTPDGGYIPRILFVAPGGSVKPEFFNEGGNPSYKYFYNDAGSVVKTMKKVASVYKNPKLGDEL